MNSGPITSWQADNINGNPWALEVVYQPHDHDRLVVRTIRSRQGIPLRATYVENHAIQLLNFLDRVNPVVVGAPTKEAEQTHSARVRDAIERATPLPTTVVIDGVPERGTRVDVLDWSVVELAWGDQAVFVTGRPETLDGLTLRSATPADLAHLTPHTRPSP
ncbi:hypothetical protein [Amycolatopsis arida]|uniref:hypothetical protein n=1 Tax=Amycolatopsis arida TaxID=587909 RepID=UPI001065F844|nr:hypothetical protein [Amycolatopsis arida]TDX84940.1 hypothetical protein CLV69_11724 [Amycolatopsis arida]